MSQLSPEQVETLLQIPPGFDFSKFPSDANNVNFDEAVKVFDQVDPNDLPILKDYEDYYDDEDYDMASDNSARLLRTIPFIPSPEFIQFNKVQGSSSKINQASSSQTSASNFLKFSTTALPLQVNVLEVC